LTGKEKTEQSEEVEHLREQLEENQRLVNRLVMSWEEKVRKTQEIDHQREKAFKV
jgi:hypothetical protein